MIAFDAEKMLNGVRGLRSYYEDHLGLEVLVTGHTDTIGDAGYNEGLAAERAIAVAAFLTDDVDAWLGYYGSAKRSKLWGTREDQYMLAALPEGGEPYYVGGIDGVPGPATTEAVRRFQREHGLDDRPGSIHGILTGKEHAVAGHGIFQEPLVGQSLAAFCLDHRELFLVTDKLFPFLLHSCGKRNHGIRGKLET